MSNPYNNKINDKDEQTKFDLLKSMLNLVLDYDPDVRPDFIKLINNA